MLSPAEKSLVLRDHSLPGLGLLLDDERLSGWVADLLGQEVCAQRRHLRYKPGTSCDLHVDVGGRPLLVSAHPPLDEAKHAKTRARSGTAMIGSEPGLGVLVATPAADRDLRGLALLYDDGGRAHLLDRLFGEGQLVHADAELTMVRYKPRRRWVGLLTARDDHQVLLRVFRRDTAPSAAVGLCALQGGIPRTPRLLGLDRRYGVVAVEFLPGQPVHDGQVAAFGQAGAALARLHRRNEPSLPDRLLAAEASAVHATSRHLGVLLPALAAAATRLAEEITARLEQMVEIRVPVHGDFSADQAVVGPNGEVGLIDLDSAGLGDPAADLGCAAAALGADVVLGELTESERGARQDALHDGYLRAGGPAAADRVAVHTAAHLLRRTIEPFRLGLTPSWPAAAHDLLSRAEETISPPASRRLR